MATRTPPTTRQAPSGIPGYALGDPRLPRAPIDLAELHEILATAGWSDEDAEAIRRSEAVLRPHVDELLDAWYGFIGSQPQLARHFGDAQTGHPIPDYLSRVRGRFRQWVFDTAAARFDQAWLDYQMEIGRRHHRGGKNRTDGVESTDHIPFRHLFALQEPVLATMKPFLARGGDSPADVEKMHAAWRKSVVVQLTLWAYPYVAPSEF